MKSISKTLFDGRDMSSFFLDEEEGEFEDEPNITEYLLGIPYHHNTPRSSFSITYGSWYDDESDVEDDGTTFFNSCDETFEMDNDGYDSDDEWDTSAINIPCVQTPPSQRNEIFVVSIIPRIYNEYLN